MLNWEYTLWVIAQVCEAKKVEMGCMERRDLVAIHRNMDMKLSKTDCQDKGNSLNLYTGICICYLRRHFQMYM